MRSLLDVGIGELLTDLATRRVGSHLVAAELELAWWTGVFEQIMRAEPSLAGFDGARLGALAAAYRELDLEHVAHLPEPVHAAVVGRIRTVLRTHRDQAELLFAELVDEHMVSLRDTIERFGDVARELRPVVAAAPMLVPHLDPPTRSVDLLVVDAVAGERRDHEDPLERIGRSQFLGQSQEAFAAHLVNLVDGQNNAPALAFPQSLDHQGGLLIACRLAGVVQHHHEIRVLDRGPGRSHHGPLKAALR